LVCHEKHQEHFLGDYDLFLEKRGWEEEGFKTTVKKGNKEERRERAEKVQELSAKLRPLKQKMDSLILKIEEGEKLKESLEEKLCRGEMEELERHGKLVKDLETHYADLEVLMQEELKLKGDPC
ncbi:MAG: hypothetical protein KDK48_03100, partial [Chlamydiia bacterium]|nr:hypothetical protein [Chlamydiia bacterium]